MENKTRSTKEETVIREPLAPQQGGAPPASAEVASGRPAPKMSRSPVHGLWALTNRDLRKWYTNPFQLAISLVQPIVWLGLFGKALNFGAFVAGAGGTQAEQNAVLLSIFGTTSYFSYLAVGMLASIILFTAAFSGMSVVFDRRFGFLDKALTTPVSRGALVTSKVLQSVGRSLVQAALVLLVAVILGMDTAHFSVLGIVGAFGILFLMAFALSSLFVTLALKSSNWQTQMAIINLLNLPLLFASNALLPITIMPTWLKYVVRFNPVSYAIDAARQLLLGTTPATHLNSLPVDFGVMIAFCAVLGSVGVIMSWRLLQE
jgi:ABC-2 type transport system permease protein